MSINKVVLEHSHAHLYLYHGLSACFHATTAEGEVAIEIEVVLSLLRIVAWRTTNSSDGWLVWLSGPIAGL